MHKESNREDGVRQGRLTFFKTIERLGRGRAQPSARTKAGVPRSLRAGQGARSRHRSAHDRRNCECTPESGRLLTNLAIMNPRTGQTGHDSDHDPQFGKTTLISERDFPKPRIMPPHPGSLINPAVCVSVGRRQPAHTAVRLAARGSRSRVGSRSDPIFPDRPKPPHHPATRAVGKDAQRPLP